MKTKFNKDLNLKDNLDIFTQDIIDFYYYVSVIIPLSLIDSTSKNKIIEQSCKNDSEGCEHILILLKKIKSFPEEIIKYESQLINDFSYLKASIPEYKSDNNFDKNHYNEWKEKILILLNK